MALPLDGLNVLDLTNVMAGPYCNMVLGDMGAAVVKIESFPDGDGSRRFDPQVNGESDCFCVLNRDKPSVALALTSPPAKATFMKLPAKAATITENFRPARADKL